MSSLKITRRNFIGKTLAGTAGVLAWPHLSGAENPKRTAIDQVELGLSQLKVSRLGIGTGSHGGRIQREIGQKAFTRVIRYGLDQGITFIDTADNYNEMHEMLREALKGIDRDRIQIQCKIWPERYQDPLAELDRFRRELGTDYFDSFLIHCVRTADWPEKYERLRDLLETAKDKKIIRNHGVSIHGIPPLKAAASTSWGDVRFVRVNHNGAHMDGINEEEENASRVTPVVEQVKKMHAAGKGIIGMKLIGNGDFTDAEQRKSSIHYVMGLDCVDAVVIGFKSPQEIDEAIKNMNEGLNT
jgi:predicted aldo/keto reductase-like oxidoreductase